MLDRTADAMWQPLAEALRHELVETGGLYGLVLEQQQSLVRRDASSLAEKNQSLDNQMQAASRARRERDLEAARVANLMGAAVDDTLSDLINRFPSAVQPLFQSLVEELLALVERIQRKLGQNRLLLARVHSLNEEVLRHVLPQAPGRTYDRQGAAAVRRSAPVSRVSFSA